MNPSTQREYIEGIHDLKGEIEELQLQLNETEFKVEELEYQLEKTLKKPLCKNSQ